MKVIPIACVTGICSSVFGFFWYRSLSATKKMNADQLAQQIAFELYQKSLTLLTSSQANVVEGHVQRYVRP